MSLPCNHILSSSFSQVLVTTAISRRGGVARDTSGCHQLSSIIIVSTSAFHDLDDKFTKKLLNIGLGNLRSVKREGNDSTRIFGQY